MAKKIKRILLRYREVFFLKSRLLRRENKSKIRYQIRGKDMTYILGARCSDGVVLVGDTKVIRGDTEVDTEEKIFQPLVNVVVGASGVSGLFDKFLRNITMKANQELAKGKYDTDMFINDCEDVARNLSERYLSRVRDAIEVLIAFRAGPFAYLYNVSAVGFSEPVRKYLAIGHGEPYGAIFMKCLWKQDKKMLEVAKIACFVTRCIEKTKLDNSVGEPCKVWLIPDIPFAIFEKMNKKEQLSRDEQNQISVRQLDDESVIALMANADREIESVLTAIKKINL